MNKNSKVLLIISLILGMLPFIIYALWPEEVPWILGATFVAIGSALLGYICGQEGYFIKK